MKKLSSVLLVFLIALSCLFASGAKESTSESTQSNVAFAPISEKVTVRAWYTFGNTNEANFLAAIADFNASQEYVTVEATQQTWNEIDAKIMAAIKAGNPPDIIFCSDAATTNNYVDLDMAVDLLPYIEDKTIGIDDIDDYNATVMEEARQWNGHMYMFPISRTGEVVYYNADFFKANNLTIPTTWDDLEKVCAEIHRITGKEAVGSDYLDENYVDMVTQLGGKYIDYENKTACFDSAESRQALSYFKNLEQNGYLRLKGDDSSLCTPFAAGLIQMVFGTSANYARLFKNYGITFDVGVAQIPTVGGTETDYVTMWGVNAVVLKSSAIRQQAAYEFIKFWTQAEYQAQWGIGYDAMPVRASAISSAAYQEYLKNALSTKTLVDEYDRLGYQPAATGSKTANNAIVSCIDEILLGTLSMEDAIAQYKADADAALQE